MKILVTYQSKTGFTKKYADWVAQDLCAEIKEISQVTREDVRNCSLLIHGGWIMGGTVSGLDKVKKLQPGQLIVFGVGFTAKAEFDLPKCTEANQLGGIPFYYYEGGMDPAKMGLIGRTVVRMVTKKPPEFADHTDREAISGLVASAKALVRG